jgi:ABC-type branched-subunit amino acid transport system permease subunit
MTELIQTKKSMRSRTALAIGIEILIYALVMALFLIEGGWILILDVVLVVGAVILLRRVPRIQKQVNEAFSENRKAVIICAAVLLLIIPIVLKSSPYWLFILITAGLYVIASLGLNLQLGSAGMMNLAAAAFMAFGAYAAGLLALDLGVPPILTVIAGSLITGLFSVLLFIPVLKTKGHYLALVTIAFQFMVVILLDNLEFTGGPQGLKNIPPFNLFGYSFGTTINLGFTSFHFYMNYYYLVLILVVLLAIAAQRIYQSWIGVTLSTIRDDEVAAKTSGVQINRWRLLIFVVGNCFIGLSGALYSHMVGFISPPNFTFEKSLVLVSIVILGGMDNIFGIIVGSLLLVVLPEKLRVISEYRFLIYGLVLVVMLIFQPKGIIPFKVRDYIGMVQKRIKRKKAAKVEAETEGEPL